MNDSQLIDALAVAVQAEHGHHAMLKSAVVTGIFQDILAKLRAAKLPWLQIFLAIPTIISLIMSGGSVQAILAAVLAIFAQPAPTPSTP